MPLHTQTISEPFRLKGRRREDSGRRGADCSDLDNGFQVGDDFFRSLFSSAGIALAVTFADGRFAKVNAALCSMLGWTEAELLGRQLKDVVRPDQHSRIAGLCDALVAGRRKTIQRVIEFSCRHGETLLGLLNLSAAAEPESKTIYLLVQLQDIGSLIRAQTELEESRQRYQALSDATFEAVFISRDGICLDANRTAAVMLGMRRNELIGRQTADIVAPEFRALAKDKMRTGCETPYRSVAIRKDGRRFHVMIQGKMVSIGGNSVRVSVVRDIDAQIRAETALRESERHLRSLLESASNFVLFRFSHNPENPCEPRQIFISPSIMEIVDGERVHDFQTFLGAVHPDDREMLVAAARGMQESSRMDIRVRIADRAGTGWRWLHIITVAVADVAGNTLFYNGIILDITGEMAATAALKTRENELKERTESLSEVNTALEVLLRKREADRVDVEEKILTNAKSLILPYLEKLKSSRLDDRQRMYLNLVESNLNEIISPLTQRMSRHYMNFTPMEIQVANLVKEGKSTKDIAFILGLSTRTIEAVRYTIRRKLGLKKKRANLRSYLLSIDGVQSVAGGDR